jgi:phospholipase/lecithinase/hemolysin
LPVTTSGAQRASIARSIRLTALALMAALVVSVGAMANPPETSAAGIKVVVVVGPVGSKTGEYRDSARHYASVARGYGASVTEIYSPNATWSRVKSALQGANMLIYLGHGNGYPSPYGAFQRYTKNGFGLNATAGNGNSNVKYWGEYYIDRDIQMAKNAVVLLNRLCYASGNSEWGAANPTKSTAIKRVDNYGAGFLRAGARVVFAEAITSISYQIRALLKGSRSMEGIFSTHPDAVEARDFYVMSSRTTWAKIHMDPPRVGKYWRSVIGDLRMTATAFRGG